MVIGTLGSGGPWQARIPEESGETVFTRYRLKDLLDRVSDLLGEPPMALRTTGRAGRGGSPAGYR